MPVHKVMRPAREISHGGIVNINSQVVVKRSEDLLEMHRPVVGVAAQAVGGTNHMSGLHAAAGQQRAGDIRPVIASCILVDCRRATGLVSATIEIWGFSNIALPLGISYSKHSYAKASQKAQEIGLSGGDEWNPMGC